MTTVQLDPRRLSAKKGRAASLRGDDFLRQRAFEDCLDRLRMLPGPMGDLMLVGNAPPAWLEALQTVAPTIQCRPLESLESQSADSVLAIGELDHAADPALAAFILRHGLRPGGRLIGAAVGDRSLARMRRALLDAERADGRAARRFHPMLDPAGLSALLTGSSLADVVIDVDAFKVRYDSLSSLVRDLRTMGCTNSLAGSVQPLRPETFRTASDLFSGGAARTEEHFEILHFSGVAPIAV